jgi:hypothetical protein
MAKAGRRHHLLIYSHMLNRWWPATLTLSLALVAVAWGVSKTPEGQAQPYLVNATLGLSGVTFIFTFLLFIFRKAAYVQAFPNYLRLVTPFLRLNISYRRFRGTTTTEMRAIFPPTSLSGWRRDIIAPLSTKTAIVINLSKHPVPPFFLRWFLSPFFFKDKTPHFVILVDDWLRFSAELDSMRFRNKQAEKKRPRDNSILSRLPRQ